MLSTGRTGTDVPPKNTGAKTQGLTPPSSATEAGRTRVEKQERRRASLCSLERVVRRCGYAQEGPNHARGYHRSKYASAGLGKTNSS